MRWIFRFLILILVLIAVAIGGLFVVPTDRIADLASAQFERATGRSLTIAGDIRPSLFPSLGVRAAGIEVSNPDWVTDGPMIRADRLNIGVDLWSLVGGTVRVDAFELVGPQFVLVQSAEGVASWDFAASSANVAPSTAAALPANDDGAEESVDEVASGGGLGAFALDLARVSSGVVLYRDLATGTELRVDALDLTLRFPGAEEAASVDASAVVNGSELSLSGEVDGVGPMLAGELRPVSVALTWDGGETGFDGRLGLAPMGAEGALRFEASNLAPLMSLAGQSAPDLPRGLGRDQVAVSGALTYASEGSLHLREAAFTFDDNRLTGDVDILPGAARPLIRARLAGGALDLSGLTEGGGESGSGTSSGGGWSREEIDVSALFSADAEAALVLGGLDLGVATLERTDLRAALDNGRLVLDIREMAAYGGEITGQYVINGRGGLSMRAALQVAEVQLQPLLSQFAGYDRLQGTGNGDIDLLMIGNDMHALMNSISGEGQFAFGQGAILGLDIWGMVRNFDTSFRGEGQRTVYDSLSASFTAEGGVIRNEDLAMVAPLGQITGSGTVDVGAQVLDYTVVPQVLGGDSSAGIRVPLRISGAWSDPNFSLDLEALAGEQLEEQIDAIEEQATEAVADALGLDVGEGQSIEEAAQESLEEQLRNEAAEQLNRLLGGN